MLDNIFVGPGTFGPGTPEVWSTLGPWAVFTHFVSQSVSMKCELWSRGLFVQKLNLMDWCEIHRLLWHCCHGLKIAASTLVTFLHPVLREHSFLSPPEPFEIAKSFAWREDICLFMGRDIYFLCLILFILQQILNTLQWYNSTGPNELPYMFMKFFWICQLCWEKTMYDISRRSIFYLNLSTLLPIFKIRDLPSSAAAFFTVLLNLFMLLFCC